MVVYKRVSETRELREILALQKLNLPSGLSQEEMQKEGFVTVEHSFDILERMNEVCPHIIAKHEEKVIGYALCMHPNFYDEIEVLRPMFDQIGAVLSKNIPYIVMGQICIDRGYRKLGVFRKLYETMKHSVLPEFECIVTEVDAKNTRSLHAHYAVGFENLKTYRYEGRKWELLILK